MYDPEQITFFAKTDARGQQVPFGIKAHDRTRHVYVIGKTGMGKSTLLENMAVQDIKNGNGLAFIDPHGQTAETLLDYIPEERIDDVVYFAPFDTSNPVSFNVMEDVGEDQRHLVVSGLMSVFKKIWVDAWSARMEYILSNTLLALLEYPDSTLLGVNRMLSDKDYRMRVIENITDPAVKSFWVDEFLKYNERYMQEAGDAIKNKIGQFTSNPLIRNIIGQPHSSFDIRKIMDDKKILIMNLSKGLVGDQNANLLGSMLTTRIYLAAMSRANLSAAEMKEAPNFYFYVDEFQSFANATFADILSEARKYKLNLTIAHQYIEQMEEEVRNAVFGNVGTIIAFRVGPFDAEVLETVFTPTFLAPDIVNLGFAQVYLTLMIDGIGSAPFSASTLPPIELSGTSCKDMVIERSRALYTEKRAGVEEEIHGWHAKSFSNKPPYIPKHLREVADGGTLPNTGANLKKYGQKGTPQKGDTASASTSTKETVVTKVTTQDTRNNRTSQNTRTPQGTEKKPYQSKNKENITYIKKTDMSSERAGRNSGQTNQQSTRRDVESGNSTRPEHVSHTKRSDIPQDTLQKDTHSQQSARKAHVPPDKNLEDLRSVLKGISGSEKDAAAKEENKKWVAPSEQKKEGKGDSSLKSALASALAGVPASAKKEETDVLDGQQGKSWTKEGSYTQKKEGQRVVQNEEKSNNDRTYKRSENQQKPKRREREFVPTVTIEETSSSHEVTEYARMKNIDDPLAPKKLERMMRVTTADKPPIK